MGIGTATTRAMTVATRMNMKGSLLWTMLVDERIARKIVGVSKFDDQHKSWVIDVLGNEYQPKESRNTGRRRFLYPSPHHIRFLW